eukprot:GHVS01002216.1.p1 GENE.GHVS01002216.1~~GHVS01002216.1.p1  ORF type:complete len:574 (-),score=68.28 GHVS01002216.1:300-2021(-)
MNSSHLAQCLLIPLLEMILFRPCITGDPGVVFSINLGLGDVTTDSTRMLELRDDISNNQVQLTVFNSRGELPAAALDALIGKQTDTCHLIKENKQVGIIWGNGSMLVMLEDGNFQAVVKDDFTEAARHFLRTGQFTEGWARRFWLRGELEDNDVDRLMLGLNGSEVFVDQTEKIAQTILDVSGSPSTTFHTTIIPNPDAKAEGMKTVQIQRDGDMFSRTVNVEKTLANDDDWKTFMKETFGVDDYANLKDGTTTKKEKCHVLVAIRGLALFKVVGMDEEYKLFRTGDFTLTNNNLRELVTRIVDAEAGKILVTPRDDDPESSMFALHLAELMPQGRGVIGRDVALRIRQLTDEQNPSLAKFRDKFLMKFKPLATQEISIETLDEQNLHTTDKNVWATVGDMKLTLQVLSGKEPLQIDLIANDIRHQVTLSPSSKEGQSFCFFNGELIQGAAYTVIIRAVGDVNVKPGSRCVKIEESRFRCVPIEDLKRDIVFVDVKGNIVEWRPLTVKASDFTDNFGLFLSKDSTLVSETTKDKCEATTVTLNIASALSDVAIVGCNIAWVTDQCVETATSAR